MLLSRDEDKGCNKKQFYFLLFTILFRTRKKSKTRRITLQFLSSLKNGYLKHAYQSLYIHLITYI